MPESIKRPYYRYPSRPSHESKEEGMSTYSEPPNLRVVATDGTDFAYRDVGEGAVPPRVVAALSREPG